MGKQKFDGVIDAVHYRPGGQIKWVRAYLRRGATWSDRVLLDRDQLVELLKLGKNMQIGSRVEFMGGTFNVTQAVKLQDDRVIAGQPGDQHGDFLEGAGRI